MHCVRGTLRAQGWREPTACGSRWRRGSSQPHSAVPCRTGCEEGCVPHSKQCEDYFFNLVKIQRLKFGCRTWASLSTAAEWTKLLNLGPGMGLWIFTPWDSEAACSIYLGIPLWLSWKIMWISQSFVYLCLHSCSAQSQTASMGVTAQMWVKGQMKKMWRSHSTRPLQTKEMLNK